MVGRLRWSVLGPLVVAVLAVLLGRVRHGLVIRLPWSLSERGGSRLERSAFADTPDWSDDFSDSHQYGRGERRFSGTRPMVYESPMTDAARMESLSYPVADSGRSIALRAELRILVQDAASAAREAQRIVGAIGGYTVQAQVAQHGQSVTAQVVLAVPLTKFQQVLEELRKLPGLSAIEHESVSGQDMTTEVIDLEARVRAARATEERLLALLQRAEKVKDVLQVEEELQRLRYQLERLEAQQRSLQERIRYALVSLTLRQTGATLVRRTLEALRGGWREEIEALADAARVIGHLAARVAVFAPLTVTLAWVGRWLVRRLSSSVLDSTEWHRQDMSVWRDARRSNGH